ncbi:uncharacterized protein LOC143055449 isoform X3 [Mytilus galloprovincialis]|uniref:uncharacterized protein LOC143055449 isoform X3 n=1 Tax=Mytilus galloprovincialis TaxID=29158 RepID=UPI003F7BB9F1
MERAKESLPLCEPCSLTNKNEHSKYYCTYCEEYYCGRCFASHSSQKSSKAHDVLTIEDVLPATHHCEPCYENQHNVNPVNRCEDCDEYLCESCTMVHLSQKQNKGHTIKPLPRPVSCYPCSANDTNKIATAFCLNCEDPEPLCDDCADQHKLMKKTKNHKMNKNKFTLNLKFSQKIERLETNIQNETETVKAQKLITNVQEKSTEPKCEPCEKRGKPTIAIYFCHDCEERYCEACMKKHTISKNTRNHRLGNIPHDANNVYTCDLCKFNNIVTAANYFCENCEDMLCGNCQKIHQSQNMSRDHKIQVISKQIVRCAICCELGEHSQATCYCLDCKYPEPLCSICAEEHTMMKRNKNHLFSKEIFTFTERLKEKETTIQDLQGENENLKVDIKFKQDEIDRLSKSLEWLKETEKVVTELRKENEEQKNELKQRYLKELSQRQEKETTIHDLQGENDKLKADIKFQQEEKEKLSKSLEGLKETEKVVTELRKENEEQKNEIKQRYLKELSQLKEKETTIKYLQGENEKLKADIKFKQDEIEKLSNQTRDDLYPTHSTNQTLKDQKRIQKTTRDVKPHYLDTPGKPYQPYVREKVNKSHEVNLKWEYNRELGEEEFYQLFIKQHPEGRWRIFQRPKQSSQPFMNVDGLKPETSYVFKVRVANNRTDEEGCFGPASDMITTGESLAFKIIKNCTLISKGIPAVYGLPIQELQQEKNEGSQIRKFTFGKPGNTTKKKTIMIVGATGTGKTTLINVMANYVMGVRFEDPFRFTLTHTETSEHERVVNEALSQTEWITCYTICSDVDSRIHYTINFIDTPGFGDTRGLEQDATIVSQIRDMFTANGAKGVATLDAVCFILKAPDARLTTNQKYIFESILALFGNDIKNNICTLVTFADGQKPPVLAALEELDCQPLPFDTYFPFNNSALFVDNRADHPCALSSFFWEMGMKSCSDFFESLNGLQTKSLLLTSEVLTKRQQLKNTILHLQEKIDLGLSKINLFDIFTKYKKQIQDNENFEYEVEESKMEKVDISGKGIHTTTCLTCNFTCHNSCAFSNDSQKANCCAMGEGGNCTECPKNCHWTQHSNVPYIFQWYTQKVKKTYSEMKDKYQQAHQRKMSQEEVLEKMHEEIKVLEVGIQIKVEDISDYGNRLKEIALRPDPLSTVQYIELMIKSEMREKKSGFNQRVETLEQCKKRAEIGKTFQIFEHRLRDTRASMKASTATDDSMASGQDERGVLKKAKDKFSKLLFG